jgi:hypothetical protein
MDAFENLKNHTDHNHCVLVLRILGRFPELLRHYKNDVKLQQQMMNLMHSLNQHLPELNEIGT